MGKVLRPLLGVLGKGHLEVYADRRDRKTRAKECSPVPDWHSGRGQTERVGEGVVQSTAGQKAMHATILTQ